MVLQGLLAELVDLKAVAHFRTHLGMAVHRDIAQAQDGPVPFRSVPDEAAVLYETAQVNHALRIDELTGGYLLRRDRAGLAAHGPAETTTAARAHLIVGLAQEAVVHRGAGQL